MTDSSIVLLKVTDVAAGLLAFALGSLVATPFVLIIASPFVISW